MEIPYILLLILWGNCDHFPKESSPDQLGIKSVLEQIKPRGHLSWSQEEGNFISMFFI